MNTQKPLYVFTAFVAAVIALIIAGKFGVVDSAAVKRGLGIAIGALAIGIGNYLPKMRPFKASRAERFAGWVFLLAGIAFVGLFLLAPIELARRASAIVGVTSLLIVAAVAIPLARGARLRGSEVSIALTLSFIYVFAVACVVYLFGSTPWVDWMFAGYWIAYSVLISIGSSRRKHVCSVDGPQDDHAA